MRELYEEDQRHELLLMQEEDAKARWIEEPPAVLAERSEATPAPALRCRVSTCWHRSLPDSDLCLGHGAEAYEHASHGCPDGVCEVCEGTNEECPL